MKVKGLLLVGGGTLTTVAALQAANLVINYQSPPDPTGPRGGLEKYMVKRTELTEQGRAIAGEVTESLRVRRSELAETSKQLTEELRAKRSELQGKIHGMWNTVSGRKDYEQFMTVVKEGMAKMRAAKKSDSSDADQLGDATARRILFIGDSLVQGVGCEMGNGPALPRAVARFLAEKWKVDVSWRALGVTGGDVRCLREEIVPLLKDDVSTVIQLRRTLVAEKESDAELLTRPAVDAVVVVCGVNDWKNFFKTGRLWNTFREDLEELVSDIKEVYGEDCKVFLPALPGVDYAPLFQEPLRTVLRFISSRWDDQKRRLAESLKQVHYVDKPADAFWGNLAKIDGMFAKDRVHPNDEGYIKWGDYIGECLIKVTPSEPKNQA